MGTRVLFKSGEVCAEFVILFLQGKESLGFSYDVRKSGGVTGRYSWNTGFSHHIPVQASVVGLNMMKG